MGVEKRGGGEIRGGRRNGRRERRTCREERKGDRARKGIMIEIERSRVAER